MLHRGIRLSERSSERPSSPLVDNNENEATSDRCYNEEATLLSMALHAQENEVKVSNASLANMLKPHGEDDVTQSVSLVELASEAADVFDSVEIKTRWRTIQQSIF